MPSAKQIAKGLAARGVCKRGADATYKLSRLMNRLEHQVTTPEELATAIRANMSQDEIREIQATIRDVLGVANQIESTYPVNSYLGGRSGK